MCRDVLVEEGIAALLNWIKKPQCLGGKNKFHRW